MREKKNEEEEKNDAAYGCSIAGHTAAQTFELRVVLKSVCVLHTYFCGTHTNNNIKNIAVLSKMCAICHFIIIIILNTVIKKFPGIRKLFF